MLTHPRLTLLKEEIHIWIASLDVSPIRLDRLFTLLSADERSRAGRYRLQHHRDFFIAGRGLLREVIAAYTGIPPSEVTFRYSAFGKPGLAFSASLPLCFNVSNSGNLAVYALALGREIGVDVEFRNARSADDAVARQVFSPAELCWLARLPAPAWQEAFFAIWTLKESYIKAVGLGFSADLQCFDVSPEPELVNALVSHREKTELERWISRSLPMPEGFAGAVTCEAPPSIIRQDWWPPLG